MKRCTWLLSCVVGLLGGVVAWGTEVTGEQIDTAIGLLQGCYLVLLGHLALMALSFGMAIFVIGWLGGKYRVFAVAFICAVCLSASDAPDTVWLEVDWNSGIIDEGYTLVSDSWDQGYVEYTGGLIWVGAEFGGPQWLLNDDPISDTICMGIEAWYQMPDPGVSSTWTVVTPAWGDDEEEDDGTGDDGTGDDGGGVDGDGTGGTGDNFPALGEDTDTAYDLYALYGVSQSPPQGTAIRCVAVPWYDDGQGNLSIWDPDHCEVRYAATYGAYAGQVVCVWYEGEGFVFSQWEGLGVTMAYRVPWYSVDNGSLDSEQGECYYGAIGPCGGNDVGSLIVCLYGPGGPWALESTLQSILFELQSLREEVQDAGDYGVTADSMDTFAWGGTPGEGQSTLLEGGSSLSTGPGSWTFDSSVDGLVSDVPMWEPAGVHIWPADMDVSYIVPAEGTWIYEPFWKGVTALRALLTAIALWVWLKAMYGLHYGW